MEFLFECSNRYFTSERSEWVRYRVEHEKRNSIFPSNHISFCLLHKHLTNKKKPTEFTFQNEEALLFIHGAKYS